MVSRTAVTVARSMPVRALVRPYGSRFFTGTLLATAICIVLDVAMLVVTILAKARMMHEPA
jgi:hypothetical protein